MIASIFRIIFILIPTRPNNYARSKPARGECRLWRRIEPCGFNIFRKVWAAWFDKISRLRLEITHHERPFVNFDLQFLNQISVLLLFSTISLMATPTNEFVQQKKQPKVTAQDCIQEILEGQKTAARQMQYLGQIQLLELQWGQDFMEDEGIFKKANTPQLQNYMHAKKKSNHARLEYEQALKEERDFLKQFEQIVLAPKNKK